MQRTKYLAAVHDRGHDTVFVGLQARSGLEVRSRRTADGIRIATWTRAQAIDLSTESVSHLHELVDARLPSENETGS